MSEFFKWGEESLARYPLLKFGYGFNQPIGVGVLPPNLKSLKFSSDEPIIEIGALPLNLKKLHIQDISLLPLLPPNLEILKFGYFFNQKIDISLLPPNLKFLVLSGNKFDDSNNLISLTFNPNLKIKYYYRD